VAIAIVAEEAEAEGRRGATDRRGEDRGAEEALAEVGDDDADLAGGSAMVVPW
jgi:hypothetical protein